jgi:hypothetical protein
MNALSGSESSAASARLPALLEDIEMRGYSADMVAAAAEAVALAREIGDSQLLADALCSVTKRSKFARVTATALVCIRRGICRVTRYGAMARLPKHSSPLSKPVR